MGWQMSKTLIAVIIVVFFAVLVLAVIALETYQRSPNYQLVP
jgi:hypothetical protein